MQSNTILQIAIYVADVLIAAGLFFGIIFFARRKFSRMFMPNPKRPNGQIVAEFWPESGHDYPKVLPIEPNGIEVRAPKGHQLTRYLFDKNAVRTCKWPRDAIFISMGISVDAPIVRWAVNNPEPINPYCTKPVVTSTMLGSLGDDDFLGVLAAASKEIEQLEVELAKALGSRIPKEVFYVMLGIVLIAAGAAAVFAYLANAGITKLVAGWGL